jgi:hypothetical protein
MIGRRQGGPRAVTPPPRRTVELLRRRTRPRLTLTRVTCAVILRRVIRGDCRRLARFASAGAAGPLRTSVLQLPSWHTPEEMRQISDLAHWIEGAVLGSAAIIALVAASGRPAAERARLAWPALVLSAGVLLFGYLVIPHHGLSRAREQWAFVFGDPQQRQHLALATLAALGGAAELFHRTGRLRSRAWQLVWPAAIITAGLLFALHVQHGTGESVARAMLIHRALGILLVAAGVLKLADAFAADRRPWLAFAWPLALLAASVLLASYREPEGAYETDHAGHAVRPRK